jgi:hypothetical protein
MSTLASPGYLGLEVIRIKRNSGLLKQMVALKDKKENLRIQINGKFNDTPRKYY